MTCQMSFQMYLKSERRFALVAFERFVLFEKMRLEGGIRFNGIEQARGTGVLPNGFGKTFGDVAEELLRPRNARHK